MPITEMIPCIASKICITEDNRVLHRHLRFVNENCILGREKVAAKLREMLMEEEVQE